LKKHTKGEIMRRAGALACTGLAILLTGCSALSSINPFASKHGPRNPPAALVDFKPSMVVHTAWSVSVGKSGAYAFSPAFAEDSVYAAAADGTVVRIDAGSGQTEWRINAGEHLTAGVGADANTVAVVAEKGMLLAFNPDGKLRWKVQASSEILSAPAVGQGLIVVRSVDNRVAAYDAETGTRRWIVQRTVPPLTLRTAPGILIAGPFAFVSLPGGRLAALALSNGGPVWEVAVGEPRGTTEIERIADTSGMPVLVGRELCAVTYQGRIACFDAITGTAGWAKPFSSDVGLAADERFVFAADEHGTVHAFARDSGISVWSNNKLANRGLSAPVSFGRAVAIGDQAGYIHFLSREDGAFLARTKIDESPIAATPIVAGQNVVFQTQAGTVTALAAE
jgi:outer membrane protein assembly factor BamB